MPTRIGRVRRLRRQAEFERVLRRGTRLDGRLFVVLARPNDLGKDRLGLAVSRKVGGAVVRNRARRLLRESFHRTAVDTGGGYDIVVLAKREIIGRTQAEVDREFEDRIRRLRRGRARPPVTPAASVD